MHKNNPLLILSCMFILNLFFANMALAEHQFDKQKMDDYLSLMSENHKGILSIEIVEKGKQVYQNQTGFSHYDEQGEKVKADAQTLYRIASITKMFTATLIMQLIEQEKLSLNTTLSEFYPQIKNADKITIDNMLMHYSGLYDYSAETRFWSKDAYEPQSKVQMIERFASFEPVFKPGSRYEYCNTNYMLLGYIIEKITGQSYQSALQSNIIDKLNLKNTQLGTAADTDKNQAQSFYFSKGDWQVQKAYDLSSFTAAGGIISTPHDLNIFINALMSGELVGEALLTRMYSRHAFNYRGIMMMPFSDSYAYGHTGVLDGFRSVLGYYPDEDTSIALIVNGVSMNFDTFKNGILSIYFNKPFTLPKFDYDYASVDIDEKQLNSLAGDYHYQHPFNAQYKMGSTLFIKENQLWAHIPNISNPRGSDLEISFIATSENTFFSASEGMQLNFSIGTDGALNTNNFEIKHNDQLFIFNKNKSVWGQLFGWVAVLNPF
jgi:D-alanyl-D-alanine carboxypeptidase